MSFVSSSDSSFDFSGSKSDPFDSLSDSSSASSSDDLRKSGIESFVGSSSSLEEIILADSSFFFSSFDLVFGDFFLSSFDESESFGDFAAASSVSESDAMNAFLLSS